MSNNLKIIKISDLPESSSVESTYFFGYDADPQKTISEQSVKIPFSAVAKASNERRIALVMETKLQLIPIGEKMKITKATGKNVTQLWIRPNIPTAGDEVEIDLDKEVDIDLSHYVTANSDAIIRIEKGADPTSTVYLFTKVIN